MATVSARTLDLIGLKCPLPVLRTRKALASMAAGATLEVTTSDPLALIDIPHLLRETGDPLLSQHVESGVARFLVRKGGVSGQ